MEIKEKKLHPKLSTSLLKIKHIKCFVLSVIIFALNYKKKILNIFLVFVKISHLAFDDDIILFVEDNVEQMQVIKYY